MGNSHLYEVTRYWLGKGFSPELCTILIHSDELCKKPILIN